jgi:hypothetical protein
VLLVVLAEAEALETTLDITRLVAEEPEQLVDLGAVP